MWVIVSLPLWLCALACGLIMIGCLKAFRYHMDRDKLPAAAAALAMFFCSALVTFGFGFAAMKVIG